VLNLSSDGLLSTLCLSWTAPVRLAPRTTLLHRRRCPNGQRRRLTNFRPTASGSPGSRPVPLEAGVVVLVPVLVGRTRMQLCHGARPLSSLHPGSAGWCGYNRTDLYLYRHEGSSTCPGPQKMPCPVTVPICRGADRSLYATQSRPPRGQPEEQGVPPLLSRAAATAEPELCQALSSRMKMTQMIKALLTFGDLPRQVQHHRRPSGPLRH
jgi:hypothetical protein